MSEAQRIKKSYCRPAIYLEETEWRHFLHGKLPSHFHVERYVWIDTLLKEYRVAIPEQVNEWAEDEVSYREFQHGIQTRFITYLPTGGQVYDNTLHPARAVVFEYELEQYVRYTQSLKEIE